MLDDVERSLISIKHRLQHRATFLLFSGVDNNVAFVWPPCSTLLNVRMPTKLNFRVSVVMVLFVCFARQRASVQATLSMANEQTYESLNDGEMAKE